MIQLFVYGTLKKGKRLHHMLGDSKHVGDKTLEGYTLYELKLPGLFPYPIAIEKEGCQIRGEVYEVPTDIYYGICAFETSSGYKEENLNGLHFFPMDEKVMNQFWEKYVKPIGEEF